MLALLKIWKDAHTANATTAGNQYDSDIVGLANGNILIVWSDNNDTVAPAFGADIVGQIYSPTGKPIGGPIFLNDGYGSNRTERNPEIAALPDGGFIVTYNYLGNSENDQLYRRFDKNGVPTGQQSYVVNDASGGTTYTDFEIVYRPDGSAVVTFRRDTGTDEDLLMRTISAGGTVGSDIEVRYDQDPSGATQGDPDNPTAAVLTDGRVIVAFVEEDNNIYGAEYTVIGTDNSISMRGNVSPASSRQDDSDVAALADGGWVITWREGIVLRAQIYNSDQSKRGGIIDLATGTDVKDTARVTSLNDGGFALVWIDRTDQEISVRTFDANGAKTSKKLDFGFEGHNAYGLDISTSPDGRILLSWQAYETAALTHVNVVSAIVDPRQGPIKVTDGTPTTAAPDGSKITGSSADDVFYGMQGDDILNGKGGNDKIMAGRGSDEVSGGSGKDTMPGGSGKDTLKGGGGNDLLKGQDGNDMLYGGSHRDTLKGNAGNDKLDGGADKDTHTGGGGNDMFIFTKVWDSAAGKATRDVITDFKRGADKIDLSAIDAQSGPGNQAFAFIGKDAFSGTKGELRYRKLADKTIIQGDRNGDGVADLEIELSGSTNLNAADFIL